PDQIHKLGEDEVARIRGLMEKAIAQTGFKGSFAEFLKMLRTDPCFYAHTATELLEKASEIAKRSDDQLPRLFGTLPRPAYGPCPPKWLRATRPAATGRAACRWARPAATWSTRRTSISEVYTSCRR